MNLYKVLIVDDEEEVREGIIKKINWIEYGFEIIGSAENGKDALEKAEKLNPDIVITDIAMPFMDGLELGKKLKEIMPLTKIIIFSGSDDFEYAQKAIKINVIEYILKPVSSFELMEILRKVRIRLDKEYDEKRNIEILKKHYNDSLAIIREQFLVSAIEGRLSKTRWEAESKILDVDFIKEEFAVAVIHFDSIKEFVSEDIFEDNIHLINISINKIVDDIMNDYSKFVSFIYSDRVVLIARFNEIYDINLFIKGLNEVCNEFSKVFGRTISIGIGNINSKHEEIKNSFRKAETALNYRISLGNGKAIYIEDVERIKFIKLEFDDVAEREFLDVIKISNSLEIENYIDEIFKKVEASALSIDKCRVYLMEIIVSLFKIMESYSLEIEEVLGENFNYYSYLEEATSLLEIKDSVKKWSLAINKYIKGQRINSSRILIEDAKKYIKENFSECELSVEQVCSYLHVSPTYFSSLFKKEVGISFVNYLRDFRLEAAVKLLNTTDDKAYIIATKVGYSQANYFSYVFRKKYGVAPSRYRKN